MLKIIADTQYNANIFLTQTPWIKCFRKTKAVVDCNYILKCKSLAGQAGNTDSNFFCLSHLYKHTEVRWFSTYFIFYHWDCKSDRQVTFGDGTKWTMTQPFLISDWADFQSASENKATANAGRSYGLRELNIVWYWFKERRVECNCKKMLGGKSAGRWLCVGFHMDCKKLRVLRGLKTMPKTQ